jgi:hypothetical protein
MHEIKERLERGFGLLQSLEKRRLDTRTPLLGYNVEYLVIDRELRQLEADILREPGALESQLVRVRRKTEKR